MISTVALEASRIFSVIVILSVTCHTLYTAVCHSVLTPLLQFGALEAVITGIMDEYPMLRRKRELFVAGIIAYCFLGSLVTTTYVSTHHSSGEK